MKFTDGLRSLIPRRDIDDPDEAIDLIDEEEGVKPARAEAHDETAAPKKKVQVVAEDESVDDEDESYTPDTVAQSTEEGDEELAPKKPLVTPLTFDVDDAPNESDDAPVARHSSGGGQKKASVARRTAALPVADQKSSSVPKKRKASPAVKEVKESPEVSDDIWDKHEETVYQIPIEEIQVNSSQPRHSFGKQSMEELTRSIEHHGILQPLVVRRVKKGYELIAGERRLRAATSLGWEQVPGVVRRGVTTSASQLELALIENIQRQDLNPIEEALAYRQLNEEYGMTHEEIGERVGRSRVGITNAIRVLQLPEEVQKGLTDGSIAIGHAKAILMIPDKEKQVRFYRHLVAEGLTVRKAETRARRIQRTMQVDDPMREKRRGRSAFEITNSGKLEDHFGFNARVRFLETKNRFEVTFRAYSQGEVEELIGRMLGDRDLPTAVDGDIIDNEDDEE